MKKLIGLLAVTSTIIACQPKVIEVIEVVDEEIEVTETFDEASVNAGSVLYSQRCTQCHDAKVIKDYSKERWDKVLPNMSNKAELTEEEHSNVYAYVYSELSK